LLRSSASSDIVSVRRANRAGTKADIDGCRNWLAGEPGARSSQQRLIDQQEQQQFINQ
jgi:hypothetical protein